ncbi:hypothetical protein ACJMK2_034751, partial [Sinanodonta woodiana]
VNQSNCQLVNSRQFVNRRKRLFVLCGRHTIHRIEAKKGYNWILFAWFKVYNKMAYLTVEYDTENRLTLTKSPSTYSWALFGGFITLGFTAACYGEDCIFWTMTYIIGGIFIGGSCMDDWEDCEFNKPSGQIILKRCSIWNLLLAPIYGNEDVVIAKAEEVTDVNVLEEYLNFFGITYQIVLQLETGISLPLSKASTFGPARIHEEIAQKIRRFLALDSTTSVDVSSQDDAYMGDTSSTEEEGEDDFEKIESDEVMDE